MFSGSKYKCFVDHGLWHLMGAIGDDLDRHHFLGKNSDLLRYVVISLFERLGYAEQHLEANGQPGWVLTKLGQAELHDLREQEKEDLNIAEDEEEDEEINMGHLNDDEEHVTKDESATQ